MHWLRTLLKNEVNLSQELLTDSLGSAKKVQNTKGDSFYIWGGPHGYASWTEMKNLGDVLCERKKKDAQEHGQGAAGHGRTKRGYSQEGREARRL